MKLSELLDLYSEQYQVRLVGLAVALIYAITLTNWIILPKVDFGFLFIFPILLAAGFLEQYQVLILCLICVILREAVGPFPRQLTPVSEARMMRGLTDFLVSGLFVRHLAKNRQMAVNHLKQIEEETKLRKDVQRELQVLVDSSPAAIMTVNSQGEIVLANVAAHRMIASDAGRLEGKLIEQYLPAIAKIQKVAQPSDSLCTEMESTGRRQNGELFRAHLWVSTYLAGSGTKLAAIVVDSSEELRDREESGVSRLLSNSRILMGTFTHEIRNLCGAIAVAHANLTRIPELAENEDFRALGNLLTALRSLASAELRPLAKTPLAGVSLEPILDDLRIVIEPSFRASGAAIRWDLPRALPPVWADPQGLLQVFLNLSQNSQRAIQQAQSKVLTIQSVIQSESVILRFADTGPGICDPERLFRPFHQGSDVVGLGLYVSRAIMRSFGGDLRYQPQNQGACFTIELLRADEPARAEPSCAKVPTSFESC